MEATAGVAAAVRGVSLPMPSSQPSRKEWRVVTEHHSLRDTSAEELERSKLGQSNERTIYERREPLDLDFCPITIDGGVDNDILKQRLLSIARQREELQQMEIELRSQFLARSELMEMQNSFDARIKEHVNANMKLQEQLHEKEKTIHELERKIEEKDREVHAIKLDNEAAWAKEDLLREQNKELASIRRERDNSEAERAHHLKQIHEYQEHIQEKEREFIELQDQHRVAQETIIIKDEQLREAQAWITRVQEMDALQSTTTHSLQAELRERTEQYNQLWLGCQRQFADMERLHLHIQQLQLELADARERSGNYTDEARIVQTNSKEVSQFVTQNNGSQVDVNIGGQSNGNSVVLSNGNGENLSQNDHVAGVPMVPSSLLGMPTYLPPGQMTAIHHPFVIHQHGGPHSMPAHVPQSHHGSFHSMSPVSSVQHWQNQEAASEASQISTHDQYQPSLTEQNHSRPDTNYDYEMSVNGQAIQPVYLDGHINQRMEPGSVIPTSTEEQVLETNDKRYLLAPQLEQSLEQVSYQFHGSLQLDPLERNNENKEKDVVSLSNHGSEGQALGKDQTSPAAHTSASDPSANPLNFTEAKINNVIGLSIPTGHTAGKTPEATLLDERSLLACIVRTIPAGSGARIRISSTLPNRLGKMLAPLQWHDYKKKYGKLDNFMAGHPELFVIEGDYIQLREGAKEIIAATAAVAKVAAAAAASMAPYSSLMPSVAVTPMAQTQRSKKAPSVDSKSNGVFESSNVKILSKHKDSTRESNGNGNGPSLDTSADRAPINGRPATNFVGKQHGRTSGTALNSRR